MADNSAGKQRGKPFEKGQSGNPVGKPKGARHKATLAAEALLDGEARRSIRRWNYDFALLSFVDRERLMQLCVQCGWFPDSDRVDIAPFDEWSDGDFDEMCNLLAATERRPIPK